MEPGPGARSGRGVTSLDVPVADPRSPDAFDAFYRTRYRDAVRLAYVLTTSAPTAEDIAQDAFIEVQSRFGRLREPWPYTRACIVNRSRTHLRRASRERAHLQLVASATQDTVDPQPSELLDAVDRLPFRQKAVIVLRYYEDLSELEIAHTLGCRPGTVKSLASRALARLSLEVPR